MLVYTRENIQKPADRPCTKTVHRVSLTKSSVQNDLANDHARVRNMEDTLAARNKMDAVRAARRNAPGASSSLSGSLTANYSHHQKEWALQIRALQNRQVKGVASRSATWSCVGDGDVP